MKEVWLAVHGECPILSILEKVHAGFPASNSSRSSALFTSQGFPTLRGSSPCPLSGISVMLRMGYEFEMRDVKDLLLRGFTERSVILPENHAQKTSAISHTRPSATLGHQPHAANVDLALVPKGIGRSQGLCGEKGSWARQTRNDTRSGCLG